MRERQPQENELALDATEDESRASPNAKTASNGAWPIVPLGEIANVKLGKMLDKAKHQTGRRLAYLRNVNVRWGTIETDDLLEMHFEDDQLDRFGLQANDVLVCEGGEPGRAAVWDGRLPDLKFQKALHRVRFRVPFDPRFLVHLLELLAKSGGLERRFTGSTIKHFTREAFLQLPVPCPPVAEQRRVVAEIEKQFTRLDAGVTALRRVEAKLKRYRAAVLEAACEGRLVPTDAELLSHGCQNGQVETGDDLLGRISAMRREQWSGRGKYKEPVAPDAANLNPLPEGWSIGSIDQLSSHLTSGSRDWSQFYDRGAGTFVLAQNIRPMRLDLSTRQSVDAPMGDAETERTRVRRNDVLVTIVGANTGDVCRVPTDLHDHFVCQSVALIRPALPDCAKFMEVYLASEENGQAQWKRFIYGQGRPHLSFDQLRATAIAVPPLAEQTRIVAEVERRFSVVEELEAVVTANLHRATRLRQSILQRAFAGQLV